MYLGFILLDDEYMLEVHLKAKDAERFCHIKTQLGIKRDPDVITHLIKEEYQKLVRESLTREEGVKDRGGLRDGLNQAAGILILLLGLVILLPYLYISKQISKLRGTLWR